nr:zinc finger, CCHC-type [Tanacetum cinerariifolium]
ETKIPSVLLEITPDLASRAIETSLSSLMGTMWCLCDPTPCGWCKTDAHATDFAWTRFKDLLQKVPHHGIDLWLQVQIFYDHVNSTTRQTIDQAVGGSTRDLGSIGEEMDKTTTLHQSLLKNSIQCLETASQFLVTASDHIRDGVRKLMTASECSRLKRDPRRFGEVKASEIL